jgi:nifR3 family TIM-barrel protein
MPASLPFTAPNLLAPMEGVTEPCFRDLVLARNPPERLGGAFTEFARVIQIPLPRRTLREHLGPRRFAAPVGLQLMGSEPEQVAVSAARAIEVGAPLVDLNFGCPAKGALQSCAGSALLREPRRVEQLVAACVAAVGEAPVTAKIRAGYDDTSLLEELARAAEEGGAAMLTVHCRTRAEGYCEAVDWGRIARAVAAVRIPVCGNGSVRTHADLERMRQETGARYAMVGRAALGNPWIFSGRDATRAEAAGFLVEYAAALHERYAMREVGVAGRIKQLLAFWTAGGLVAEEERRGWMSMDSAPALLARLEALRRE